MYIVFEGIDGSGKSTQIALLREYLEDHDVPVRVVQEPTDNGIGYVIKKYIRDPPVSQDKLNNILALLFAADRLMIDTISEDEIILSDRSYLSSLAYQKNNDWVHEINRYAPQPDLVILFDMPAHKSESRHDSSDIFENDEYLKEVRDNYLDIVQCFPHHVIAADRTILEVAQEVREIVKGIICNR